MKTATIYRTATSDQGTKGILIAPGFYCRTLELPWRENRTGISMIPAGIYHVKVRNSPKYGLIYWLTDVQGRTWILIHSGNYAGDKSDGYKTHTNGCILLGSRHGTLAGQEAVLVSKDTVRKFMRVMNNEEFSLKIMEVF